jgi:drug/metabolite transporter (DMT)-like permease
MVLMGSVFSFLCYLYALQHLPTEQVSIYAYVNPVVALLLGVWLFDEKISLFIITGGAVALLGVWLVNKAFKNATTPEQPETEGM